MSGERPHPGDVWREVIEESGRSQAEVARAMRVSAKHLNQILHREALPSAMTAVAFSHALGISSRLMWQLVADYKLQEAEEQRRQLEETGGADGETRREA